MSKIRVLLTDDHTLFRQGFIPCWLPKLISKWWAKRQTAPKRSKVLDRYGLMSS